MTRRQAMMLAALVPGGLRAATGLKWPKLFRRSVTGFLEKHRRPDGAYGWSSDVVAHVSPTFGVAGSYRLLGVDLPESKAVAEFVRNVYPVPERRRTERPLWRLDYEQVQTLLWLDEPVDSFRPLAETWTAPAEFTTRYELGGNPVFQHQAMAVRVRKLLGLSPSSKDDTWKEYFLARRRQNGTFNNTPAADGSDGHVMNTLWGLWAAESLGVDLQLPRSLTEWIRNCQLPSGGFTYMPGAKLGAADDIAYTWAALNLLEACGETPRDQSGCAGWIESLQMKEGGFQDRPGGEPNPVATYYALDSMRLLSHVPRANAKPAATARRYSIPDGARVFTVQIQAPGKGSPQEAAIMAEALGIHIWAAKNAEPDWIREAQRAADARRIPVTFAVGDEEYGTYVSVPGLGTYSHLADLVAPADKDFGAPMPKKEHAYPWSEFRDKRITPLRRAKGRMVWQFLENEELTRVLLDEAVESGTYSCISSFHFGNENFLHSQPYLQRWYGRLAMVGLQDAHAAESWWWGDQLAGFRTLFIAKEPTWDAWLEALDKNHVMAVRHDRVTNWKTHLAGGTPDVREFVSKRQAEWRWWGNPETQIHRPAAVITVLKPGMAFEAGAPEQGVAVRVRLQSDNSGQGIPQENRAKLLSLEVDGHRVQPEFVQVKNDRYHLHRMDSSAGKHAASARVRVLATGEDVSISTEWEDR